MHIHGRTRRAPSPMRRANHAPKCTKVHGCMDAQPPGWGAQNLRPRKWHARLSTGAAQRDACGCPRCPARQGKSGEISPRVLHQQKPLESGRIQCGKKQAVIRKRVSRKTKTSVRFFHAKRLDMFQVLFLAVLEITFAALELTFLGALNGITPWPLFLVLNGIAL